jgi:peptidoglycan hydrolase-like protein with peptidoglycan-binding domain
MRKPGAIMLALTLGIAFPAFAHDACPPGKADVRGAQETLEALGYQVGSFDGRMGPRTRTAIRNFQRDKGLNATGELDEATLAALERTDDGTAGREATASGAPDRAPTAATIRRAQQKLERLGYPVGAADGVLGAETRTALRNFQRDKNLNATGELDDETLSALDQDVGSATSGVGAR